MVTDIQILNKAINKHNIESVLLDLFKFNSGIDIMDSGGADGRRWQQNQKHDIRKKYQCKIEFDLKIGEVNNVSVVKNAYFFLKDWLIFDEVTDQLNKHLRKLVKECDNYSDIMYMDENELIPYRILDDYGQVRLNDPDNTYNYDEILDHSYQFRTMVIDYDTYILIQIHTGADIRGGYSSPVWFKINEDSVSDTMFYIQGDDNEYYTDDMGRNWYNDDSGDVELEEVILEYLTSLPEMIDDDYYQLIGFEDPNRLDLSNCELKKGF